MRRRTPYTLLAIAVLAVLAPAVRDRDSFPLSSYPMFSYNRGRIADFDTAVGIDASGNRHRLSPEAIAGGSEPVRAAATVTKSIARGDAATLCREIAARVDDRAIVEVDVVTERHDVIAWFDGNEGPLGIVIHASCEVAP